LEHALRGDAFSLADPAAVAELANGGSITGIERLDLYGSSYADSVEGGAGGTVRLGNGSTPSASTNDNSFRRLWASFRRWRI
jgi:hypothetical protein